MTKYFPLFYNHKTEKQPDFIVANLNINYAKLVEELDSYKEFLTPSGYLPLQVLKKRDGEGYNVQINTYKPNTKKDLPDNLF